MKYALSELEAISMMLSDGRSSVMAFQTTGAKCLCAKLAPTQGQSQHQHMGISATSGLS